MGRRLPPKPFLVSRHRSLVVDETAAMSSVGTDYHQSWDDETVLNSRVLCSETMNNVFGFSGTDILDILTYIKKIVTMFEQFFELL